MLDLDLRSIASPRRDPTMLAAFDALKAGEEMRLTTDREPRALRGALERTRSQQYVWLQHRLGQDLWEITLRRLTAVRPEHVSDLLRRSPLFADAHPESVRQMEAVAIEHPLAHGDPVVEQESEWGAFGLVWSGSLTAIITSPLGREYGLYDVLSGEPFGEIALMGRGPTIARFVATSHAARVLIFPGKLVASILASDIAVSRAMNDHLAQRMRTIVERFSAQTSLSTVARVATALLLHAATDVGLQPVLSTLADLTQVELAAAAGTVKEVVNRALAELESTGAVQRSGGHIIRVDREKLAGYAKCL